MMDEERDDTEFELTRRILATDLPTLAICRGAQVLNAVLGGTLHDHIPKIFGDSVKHRLPPLEPCSHEITVEQESELAKMLGETKFSAVSWHHQAIDKPGHGLSVVAHAPDGVIEAVEKPDHPWLFAVQWHPEVNSAEDPLQQRLFNEHVKATMRRRK
jgi:putative glutamine amidotransferase